MTVKERSTARTIGKIRKVLGKLFNFFIVEFLYNGHLQSLGAVGIAYTSSILLNVTSSMPLLLSVYLMFQAIYYLDRYLGLKSDVNTNVKRTKHIKFYATKIPFVILFLVLTMTFIIATYSNLMTVLAALMVVLLGFMYPLRYKNLTKKIALFKNYYVSSVFALMILFPITFYYINLQSPALTAFLVMFVFIESMITQVILDLKDTSTDKDIGLLTLPVVLGKERTFTLLIVLSIMTPVFIYLFRAFIKTSTPLFGLIPLNLAINLLSVKLVRDRKVQGYILSTSKFFLWFLLVFILK